jgi:hypothetical protein
MVRVFHGVLLLQRTWERVPCLQQAKSDGFFMLMNGCSVS